MMPSQHPWWAELAKDLVLYGVLLLVLDYLYTVSMSNRSPSELLSVRMFAWLRDRWPRVELPRWVSLLERRDLPGEESPEIQA